MLTLIICVIVVAVAWRLFKGLVRTVLLVAAGAFAVFFLMQPTSVSPAVRTHVAVHEVAQRGQAVTRFVRPRWGLWWNEIRHL